MLFKQFYTWIKYKTLPPSFLFKNRLFVERDSKRTRVLNNLGLTFRNERWTNWEAPHVDWRWIDIFILMSRYVGGFLFALWIWWHWANYLVDIPVLNHVSMKLWLCYDFFDYYSLYLVWLLLLMRSFIWDTFILVLLSGANKQYYPLLCREEATRKEVYQMRAIITEHYSSTPPLLKNPKFVIWHLMTTSNPIIRKLVLSHLGDNLIPVQTTELLRQIYRVHYLLNKAEPMPVCLWGEDFITLPENFSSLAPLFSTYKPSQFSTSSVHISSYHTVSRQILHTLTLKGGHKLLLTSPITTNLMPQFTINEDLLIKPIVKEWELAAKNRRTWMTLSVFSPNSHIMFTKLAHLKSHVASIESWAQLNKSNLWAKSINADTIFNFYHSGEFLTERRPNYDRTLTTLANTRQWKYQFNQHNAMEESFIWLIKRAQATQRIDLNWNLIQADANQIVGHGSELGGRVVTPFAISPLSNLNAHSGKRQSEARVRHGFASMEALWGFWTHDLTRDFAEIYLSLWGTSSQVKNRNVLRRKFSKFYFKRRRIRR